MKSTKERKIAKKKWLLVTLGVILGIAILILFILEKTRVTNLFSSMPQEGSIAKTTSTAPSAQPSFSQGSERTPVPTTDKEGSVTDNHGKITEAIPGEENWTISQDKVITIYNPSKGGTLKSGQSLMGRASVPKISFRLVDDISGVIARGDIAVFDGKFTGTFNFSTNASTGRVDVFTTASDGVESNNISIPIHFDR